MRRGAVGVPQPGPDPVPQRHDVVEAVDAGRLAADLLGEVLQDAPPPGVHVPSHGLGHRGVDGALARGHVVVTAASVDRHRQVRHRGRQPLHDEGPRLRHPRHDDELPVVPAHEVVEVVRDGLRVVLPRVLGAGLVTAVRPAPAGDLAEDVVPRGALGLRHDLAQRLVRPGVDDRDVRSRAVGLDEHVPGAAVEGPHQRHQVRHDGDDRLVADGGPRQHAPVEQHAVPGDREHPDAAAATGRPEHRRLQLVHGGGVGAGPGPGSRPPARPGPHPGGMRPRRLSPLSALLAALAGLVVAGLAARAAGSPGPADAFWLVATAAGVVTSLVLSVRGLRARSVGVDVVALLALVGAAAVGEYLAGALVALMLATGRVLEERAQARAGRSLSELVARSPRSARREGPDGLVVVDVADVSPGHRLLVGTGEVVPVDGRLLGPAVLDESTLTGEPLPVERGSGDDVRSGAVNAGPPARMVATATAQASTYAGIVRLVEQAGAESAPFVRTADRIAAGFVPFALGVAGLAWAVSGDPVRAVAVLVVATPCPLLLAAPVAVLSGVSRAARLGVVVKGGGPLEQLAQARVLLLDKTGTLTRGRPDLVDVVTGGESPTAPDTVLRLAASLEQVSATCSRAPWSGGRACAACRSRCRRTSRRPRAAAWPARWRAARCGWGAGPGSTRARRPAGWMPRGAGRRPRGPRRCSSPSRAGPPACCC